MKSPGEMIEAVVSRLFGQLYECNRCSERFRGNRERCPNCGHTVFQPVG